VRLETLRGLLYERQRQSVEDQEAAAMSSLSTSCRFMHDGPNGANGKTLMCLYENEMIVGFRPTTNQQPSAFVDSKKLILR
jgi:hypothetical protein